MHPISQSGDCGQLKAIAPDCIQKLVDAIGAENVLIGRADLAVYGRDYGGFPRLAPGAVALPTSVDQLDGSSCRERM